MLKLCAPSKTFKAGFKQARAKVFNDIVGEAGFDPDTKTGLPWARRFVDHLQANLDPLLAGEPKALIKEIGKIEADADFKQFAMFCALGKKPKVHPMRPLYNLVKELFDYDAMCADKVNGAYALVKQHGQRICPYCHMHHLNFHLDPSKKSLNLRPPLDHFFPRSVYPYLGTSLFNLVPACEQCNSRIKLAKDPRGRRLKTPLAHPFDASIPLSFESGWTSALPIDQIKTAGDFKFCFSGTDTASKDFAAFFRLQERYEWYEHEVLDLVEQYRRLLDCDAPLSSVVDPVGLMLGYATGDVRNRAGGVMLEDAARRIVAAHPLGT
jgi:hypothetical protein